MTNDSDVGTDPPEGDRSSAGTSSEAPASCPADPLSTLGAVAAVQRRLAGVNFTAMAAAHRVMQPYAAQMAHVIAAQDAVTKSFARSVDFSGLAATHKELQTSSLNKAAQQWTNFLRGAVDYSAFGEALASATALFESSVTKQVMEDVARQTVAIEQTISRVTSLLSDIDLASWLDLDRWLPGNLRGLQDHDLAVVAAVALDEGIPLSWVPRVEIVAVLIEAGGPQERLDILTECRNDILDDCEDALVAVNHEWAVQCRSAINALRQDLYGPAQSHASNIVDSIVYTTLGNREDAVASAQDDYVDLPLSFVAENFTLRPLFRAFTQWYPRSGLPPPPYFARHPTSHAVGHIGLFNPRYALVGIMLATSLTVQYELVARTEAANESPDAQ